MRALPRCGGRLARCLRLRYRGHVHLSAIPPLDYAAHLFQEREVRSVTANTRADGRALLQLAAEIPLQALVEEFPLDAANEALRRLKEDEIEGAAVLRVGS